MSPSDDIEQLLGQRFSSRALAVRPMADPGPVILERAVRVTRRRRDRRIAGALGLVVLLVLAGFAAVGPRHSGTRLRTANGSTTTSAPGCAVAATCQPAAVSSIVVGSVPSSFVVTSEPPPAAPTGQHVVELTYTSSVRPTHRLGTSAHQLVIRIATASAADTAAIAQQVAGWPAIDVGPRQARAESVVNGSGTPAETTTAYLQIQLSPTVTLSIRGESLTTDQLVAVALTITLR